MQDKRRSEILRLYGAFHRCCPSTCRRYFVPACRGCEGMGNRPAGRLTRLLPKCLFFIDSRPRRLRGLLGEVPRFTGALNSSSKTVPLCRRRMRFLRECAKRREVLGVSRKCLIKSRLIIASKPLGSCRKRIVGVSQRGQATILRLRFLKEGAGIAIKLRIIEGMWGFGNS